MPGRRLTTDSSIGNNTAEKRHSLYLTMLLTISAPNSLHGTSTSATLKNSSRPLFPAYFSKPLWFPKLICPIPLCNLIQLYPG